MSCSLGIYLLCILFPPIPSALVEFFPSRAGRHPAFMVFREECLFFVPARAVGGTTTPHSLAPTIRCERRGLLLAVVVPPPGAPNSSTGIIPAEGRQAHKTMTAAVTADDGSGLS